MSVLSVLTPEQKTSPVLSIAQTSFVFHLISKITKIPLFVRSNVHTVC